MKKRLKPIPKFANEDEERQFWEEHDSSEYLDWGQAQQVVMPRLKPTTKTISLRLPQHLLDSIKAAANARDVPYQSLIKIFLKERIDQELSSNPTLELSDPDTDATVDAQRLREERTQADRDAR